MEKLYANISLKIYWISKYIKTDSNNNNNNNNNKINSIGLTTKTQKEEEQLKVKDGTEGNGTGNSEGIMDDNSKYELSLLTENTNSIGVYGRPIKRLRKKLDNGNPQNDIFDEIAQEVYNDLRLDVFPRFCRSHLYQMYLRFVMFCDEILELFLRQNLCEIMWYFICEFELKLYNIYAKFCAIFMRNFVRFLVWN